METKNQIIESIKIKQLILADDELASTLKMAITSIVETCNNGGKVLFCGNGGSAADAQHLAAELSGRFYFDRPPINAEALHVNSSFVTATANDHSFDVIYERMIQAIGKKDDILIAFSTSGKSPNIIKALVAARALKLKTIGFTGESGEGMLGLCDLLFKIPSQDTPRIQEMHMLLGHIICENVETILFKK